jgi:hypothetical protein
MSLAATRWSFTVPALRMPSPVRRIINQEETGPKHLMRTARRLVLPDTRHRPACSVEGAFVHAALNPRNNSLAVQVRNLMHCAGVLHLELRRAGPENPAEGIRGIVCRVVRTDDKPRTRLRSSRGSVRGMDGLDGSTPEPRNVTGERRQEGANVRRSQRESVGTDRSEDLVLPPLDPICHSTDNGTAADDGIDPRHPVGPNSIGCNACTHTDREAALLESRSCRYP